MFQQKLFLTVALGVLMNFTLVSSAFSQNVPSEQLKSAQNSSDSAQIMSTDSENVPTITAEGDFLVPTFMLPAAGSTTGDGQLNQLMVPSESVVVPVAEPIKVQTEHVETKTKTVKNMPVVKITQTELTPVSEQMAVERFLTGKTTKTTKMYKEALARQRGEEYKEETVKVEAEPDTINSLIGDEKPMEGAIKKKRLLLPLQSLPQKKTVKEDLTTQPPVYKVVSSVVADQVLADAQNNTKSSVLMPHDIKVTFYPNSAEFSGQTVKWIKVFSLQALNDPRYIVHVRMSTKNPDIQQKRLYVIQRLFENSGLSSHQIAVDYVDRPADSLILRLVEKPENVQVEKVQLKNGKTKVKKTINW